MDSSETVPDSSDRRNSPTQLFFQTDFHFSGDTKVELLSPTTTTSEHQLMDIMDSISTAPTATAPAYNTRSVNPLTVSPVLNPIPPPDPSVPVPALPEHRGIKGALRPWTKKFLRQRTSSGKSDRLASDSVRGRKKRILFVTDTYLPSVNGGWSVGSRLETTRENHFCPYLEERLLIHFPLSIFSPIPSISRRCDNNP